jgi:hypothetical protein
MKQQTVVLIFALVIIVVAIYHRQKSTEAYVLPDINTDTSSSICPDGYVLVCVSSNLYGVSDTIPFPPSLPNPCSIPDFPSKPICLPHSKHIRPSTYQK